MKKTPPNPQPISNLKPKSAPPPPTPPLQPHPAPPALPRLTTLGLLGLLALSLLLSLPGMPAAVRSIERVNPFWIAVAVALELASDISFVVVYRLFFDRVERRDARALAWTSQAAGALLPGGGVGGYAVSGWLTRLTGQPTGWIVRRSSALFFLTSAVNAAAVIVPGALLLAGVPGPHQLLLAGLPALLASAATVTVLVLPALLRRRGGVPTGSHVSPGSTSAPHPPPRRRHRAPSPLPIACSLLPPGRCRSRQ